MLFYKDLDKIVFSRNELFDCDELLIISGYVGPTPVHELSKLPIKTTVIYGMYPDAKINEKLHSALIEEKKNNSSLNIFYSSIPVHAKCYIWKHKGSIVTALIGSANFTTSGLTNPFKEVLAETTKDTFKALEEYSEKVINNSIDCEKAEPKKNKSKEKTKNTEEKYTPDICTLPLYIVDEEGKKEVPLRSGINWGQAKKTGSHVNINDAYIKISSENLKHYPQMFPAKLKSPFNIESVKRKDHRHNDNIEMIWDDGTRMTGLLEGSVVKKEDGKTVLYPKQISSSPQKSILGEYIRKRLGVEKEEPITMKDLNEYGRTSIDVSLLGEGIYYFDFSNK